MCNKWDKIKNSLQKSLKSGIFELWIKPLSGEYREDTLFIKAPNDFVASWVKKKLYGNIKKAAMDIIDNSSIEIVVKSGNGKGVLKRGALTNGSVSRKPIIWRYSFEDFVVGISNELAYNVCNLLCKNRSITNNLFLFSTSGLGKTHLLHAIGNYYYKNGMDRTLKIVYLSSDQLANLMVKAFKNGSFASFKEFYTNNVDILLLEDIHFFQGKYKMQEELLSIIKTLENKGKNVIFTSSFMPKELKKLDSQLTSYFCSGFVVPIDKPDIELRLRIIEREFQRSGFGFGKDTCEFIAKRITCDIRQLKSCIQNVVLKATISNKKVIDMDIVQGVVENYESGERVICIKDIAKMVCEAFKIRLDILRSKSRKKEVVIARNTAFYLARKFTDLSLKEIGRHLNRRHSTVLKGITAIEMEIKKDSPIGRQACEIAQKLENRDF